MADTTRKATAMLESALEELAELNGMLDAFQRDGDQAALGGISEKMRAMAPKLHQLSLDAMCKSRENAPLLLRLSSGMKEAVTRSKQLALVSHQREPRHLHSKTPQRSSSGGGTAASAYIGISSALDVAGQPQRMSVAAGGASIRSLSCSAPPMPGAVLSAAELKRIGSEEKSRDSDGSIGEASAGDEGEGSTPHARAAASAPEPLEGWLTKRGESGIVKVWRMRWFRQVGSRLYYFDNPQSVLANGHIALKQVKRIVEPSVANGIDVITSSRTYHLQALDQQRRDKWFSGLTAWVEYLSESKRLERKSRSPLSAPDEDDDEDEEEQCLVRTHPKSKGGAETSEVDGHNGGGGQVVSEEPSDEELIEELILDDEESEEEVHDSEVSKVMRANGGVDIAELKETVKERDSEIAELRRELEIQKNLRTMAGGDQGAYIGTLLTKMKLLSEDLNAKEEETRELRAATEPLRSDLEQLQMKNTSLQSQLQQAREEMKAKDTYITTLRQELATIKEELPVRSGQLPHRQSPGLQRYKEETEKLRGSVRAHQTQNVFLSSELARMEEEHKTYAEAQDHTMRRLRKELKDVTKQFQELRQTSLVAGGASASHLEELEAVKQELFYTLGVGIKLNLSREGKRCNINIQSLFEEGKHIPFNKYNEWLLSRMTEASEKNK